MSKLNKEELLKELKKVFDHYLEDLRDYPSEVIVKQAYQQTKAIITKFDEECVKSFDAGYKARVIEKLQAEPGGLKPSEYMHEWLEKDAVLLDLPAEEIIEALARDNKLLKAKFDEKPQVTEEWIEEKAKELQDLVDFPFITAKELYLRLKILKNFIHSLVEEIHGRKQD